MSETPFFKTRMGQRFYEHTMPELVKQLERLNVALEQVVNRIGQDQKTDEREL